jgi:hypothetical protein
MSTQSTVKDIAKDLFSLKREYEEGRVVISSKIFEAKDLIRKFSYQRVRSFSFDDPSVVEEVRGQLGKGKKVLILACADSAEYELYAKTW